MPGAQIGSLERRALGVGLLLEAELQELAQGDGVRGLARLTPGFHRGLSYATVALATTLIQRERLAG